MRGVRQRLPTGCCLTGCGGPPERRSSPPQATQASLEEFPADRGASDAAPCYHPLVARWRCGTRAAATPASSHIRPTSDGPSHTKSVVRRSGLSLGRSLAVTSLAEPQKGSVRFALIGSSLTATRYRSFRMVKEGSQRGFLPGASFPLRWPEKISQAGLSALGWNDVSLTVRAGEIETISRALSLVDATTAHPSLPEDMASALKFGLCLPPRVAEAVLVARTSRPQDVAAAVGRPQRRVVAPGP